MKLDLGLRERERLLFSVAIAVIVHALALLAIYLSGFAPEPYPESTPVYITLPDYEEPEPVPVPVPIEEPIPEPEPAQEPEIAVTPEPEPVEPETVQPVPSTPAVERGSNTLPSPTESAETAGRDAPPEAFDFSDDPQLAGGNEQRAEAREAGRDDELFARAAVPEQPIEGPPDDFYDVRGLQRVETLSEEEQQQLTQKQTLDAEFAALLDRVERAVANENTEGLTDSADTSSGTRDSGPRNPDSTSIPGGGGGISFNPGEGRGFLNFRRPDLEPADFNGTVPEFTYILVFDVDADGYVVQGSLIIRNGSGYTLADQKVRRAVAQWRFEPAEGSPDVPAVAHLTISRS